jgi:hypothetical protein
MNPDPFDGAAKRRADLTFERAIDVAVHVTTGRAQAIAICSDGSLLCCCGCASSGADRLAETVGAGVYRPSFWRLF